MTLAASCFHRGDLFSFLQKSQISQPSPPAAPSNLRWVLIPRILNRLLEIPKQTLDRTILIPVGNNLVSDPVSRFRLHLLALQDPVCREIALALEVRLDPVA